MQGGPPKFGRARAMHRRAQDQFDRLQIELACLTPRGEN